MAKKRLRTDGTYNFTDEEKLAIITRALELLDGGKRWIKRSWWSNRYINPKNPLELTECYCINGALETAAQELGLIAQRREDEYVASSISLKTYIGDKFGIKKIYGFNDDLYTKWSDVSKALNGYKRVLSSRVKKSQA